MIALETVASALADPMRVEILDLLAGGRRELCCSPAHPGMPVAVCACDVRAAMGGVAPSRLAYHLKLLRAAGLVHEARRGKWVYYTLNRETLEGYLAAVSDRWLAVPGTPPGRPARAAGEDDAAR